MKAKSKGSIGGGLMSLDIGSGDHLEPQNLQTPVNATNTTMPEWLFPAGHRHTLSRPDAIFFVLD